MKKLIANSVLAGILAMATGASAEMLTEEDYAPALQNKNTYCRYLSIEASEIAAKRDKGVTRGQVRAIYAGYVDVRFILNDIFDAVDLVFEYPRLSPEDESAQFYYGCIEFFESGGGSDRESFNF